MSASVVRALLDVAVQAPSAMNAQPWVFAVIQDRAWLRQLSERAKALALTGVSRDPAASALRPRMQDDAFNVFYDAGTVIVIGCDRPTRFTSADCWLAAGTLMTAAREHGLGTCCIGLALEALNTPEVKRALGFADDGAIVAALTVGYPAESPPAPARRAPRVRTWLGQHADSDERERYASEHPAGYLASRPGPPKTERVGHPPDRDDPGLGAQGRRQLGEGARELSLAEAPPESLLHWR